MAISSLWAINARIVQPKCRYQPAHSLCFFAGDVPCLAQEWKYGKLAGEYFVKDADIEPIPKSELSPESDDGRQFLERQQRLDDLLAEIEQNERTIKQNIANWYRKESERQRRERAISQSAAKREAILSRTEGRNAAKAAAWELQLQHALAERGNRKVVHTGVCGLH